MSHAGYRACEGHDTVSFTWPACGKLRAVEPAARSQQDNRILVDCAPLGAEADGLRSRCHRLSQQ